MNQVIFNKEDESDDQEVRISPDSGSGKDDTRLKSEAEEKLTDSSDSEGSLPASGPSVESHQSSGSPDMSTIQKQNKEIISLLEEIREEVVDDSSSGDSSGGAPADQLL